MTDILSAAKFLNVSVDSLVGRAALRKTSVFQDTRLSASLMIETLGFKEATGLPRRKEYKGVLHFLQWLLSAVILGGGGFALGYLLIHPLPDWMRPSGNAALYWSIIGNGFWGVFLLTWGNLSIVKSLSKENLRGITRGLISDPHIESFQKGEHRVYNIRTSLLYSVSNQGYFGDYSGFGVTVNASAAHIPPRIERTLARLTDGIEVSVYYDTADAVRFSLENPAKERTIGFALGAAAALSAFGFFILSGALFRLI